MRHISTIDAAGFENSHVAFEELLPLCWRTSWQRLRRWPTARLVVEFVRQTDSEVRGNTVGIRVGVLEVGLGPR